MKACLQNRYSVLHFLLFLIAIGLQHQVAWAEDNVLSASKIPFELHEIEDSGVYVSPIVYPNDGKEKTIIARAANDILYSGSRPVVDHRRENALFLELIEPVVTLWSANVDASREKLSDFQDVWPSDSTVVVGKSGQICVVSPSNIFVLNKENHSIDKKYEVRIESGYRSVGALFDSKLLYLIQTPRRASNPVQWNGEIIDLTSGKRTNIPTFKKGYVIQASACDENSFAIGFREDVSAPDFGTLTLLDAQSGRVKWAVEDVYPLALTPIGDHLIVIDGSSMVRIFETANGTLKANIHIPLKSSRYNGTVEFLRSFWIDDSLFILPASEKFTVRVQGLTSILEDDQLHGKTIKLNVK